MEQWASYMEQGNHNANPRKWIHWINFSQSSLWFFVYSCQYNITYPPSKKCSFLGSSNSYNLTYYKKYHQYANQNYSFVALKERRFIYFWRNALCQLSILEFGCFFVWFLKLTLFDQCHLLKAFLKSNVWYC